MRKKDIHNLIKGELSNEREKEVIDWLLKNPKKRAQYEILKAKHVAASLNKVNINTIYEQKDSSNNHKKFIYSGIAIAAIILIAAFVTFNISKPISYENEQNTLALATTKKAEKRYVLLEDSTKVTLNANSVLSYPKHFIGNTREVTLKGEAFFEVTKNQDKPFIVSLENGMKIKVLGTSFNIKSYAEDKDIKTTLVTGKVKVIKEQDSTTIDLVPSQQATYIKEKDKIIVEKVDTKKFTSWKENKFIYNETPMAQVLRDLERAYNVTFIVESKDIYNYKYNGVFDNFSINQILEIFEISSPITYHIKNNRITLNPKK
ncbi:FecR family protein [Snuella sedimenti]|uniref:FecR family protein n=1 Tax=Snuella sedimenti TaxID=2798802 RepID=A0A8J7IIK0_9FLAO|nr:FecR family protein [Snuella sedimenti]MBJ6368971.1 FecR family protein [Snuella sedimenti]